MQHSYTMRDGDLLLCPLEKTAIEQMRILRNANRSCFVYSGEIAPEGQAQWFERYLHQPGDYVFSVFYGGRWVGSVSLYDVREGEAEFGRLMIDRQAAGRGGLGRTVTETACQLGFDQLGLHRIHLEVYEDNLPARRTYEQAGFVPCGTTADASGRGLVQMERKAPLYRQTSSVPC